MVSFGMEDFAKKYGTLQPSQFVDVMSLVGDRSDNIPGCCSLLDHILIFTRFHDMVYICLSSCLYYVCHEDLMC